MSESFRVGELVELVYSRYHSMTVPRDVTVVAPLEPAFDTNTRSQEIRKPVAGQIYRENDIRFERYVRVEKVGEGRRSVAIRTVMLVGGRWLDAPRSRLSYADVERFGAKRRSGYSLYVADGRP